MKADRAEAAARRQHLERTCEPRLDLRELVIDMNAQCLKGARCRVLAGLASRNGVRDDLGETARRRDRGCEACGDDRARDALREALLAVIANDARELAFRRACDELRRSHSRARIHPHVERTVLYEAEAARGVVELRRGHTEIEQHAVNSPEPSALGDDLVQARKRTLHQRQAILCCESLASCRDCGGIAIDCNDPALLADTLQDRGGMTAPTEGRIHIATARAYVQRTQHFLEKHGHVLKHRRTYRLIDASNRSHARGPRRESREDTKVCRIPGRASDADTRFAHNDNDSSSGGSSSADSSAFSHSSRFSFHSASSQSSKRLP